MDNIIYTAVFNEYDQLREIKLEPGWRAICFTNQPDLKSNSWEIRQREFGHKIFRNIKIRPNHFLPMGYKKSVWIDGNLELKIPLSELIKDKNGFWLMTHPDRDCVYDEAKRCIELKKDNADVITKQVQRYLLEGYPHKNGLSATGVLIRDNNYFNAKFGEKWWDQIKNGSIRDQLSFNYVAWKLGFKFHMFPFLENFHYYFHLPRIKAMEEREIRFKERHGARAIRDGKLKARRTAAYYKKYGQDGDNKQIDF